MGKIMLNSIEYSGGGGNADVVHLTQAEYDALPSSKLTDDKVYMITDVNGDGSQFQPIIYSENEREIGVWVDGKPLYQKTFLGTVSGDSPEYTIDVSDLDIESIVYSSLHNTSNTETQTPLYYYSNTDFIRWYSNDGMTEIKINSNGNSSAYPQRPYDFRLTIQYTKTTDAAGSGQWTPQGVPAVHYSTDEQVIGTWIDGKTIYQKTISQHINSDSDYTVFANGISEAWLVNSMINYSSGRWMSPYYQSIGTLSNSKYCYVEINNGALVFHNQSNSAQDWIATIQYTKTSS